MRIEEDKLVVDALTAESGQRLRIPIDAIHSLGPSPRHFALWMDRKLAPWASPIAFQGRTFMLAIRFACLFTVLRPGSPPGDAGLVLDEASRPCSHDGYAHS